MINVAPKGLVLGCLLFVIYVHNLEMNVVGIINKFANETKIYGIVDSEKNIPMF